MQQEVCQTIIKNRMIQVNMIRAVFVFSIAKYIWSSGGPWAAKAVTR